MTGRIFATIIVGFFVVLDVPAGTVNILFGALLVGTGRAWIDDLKIETVGKDVSATKQLSNADREPRSRVEIISLERTCESRIRERNPSIAGDLNEN